MYRTVLLAVLMSFAITRSAPATPPDEELDALRAIIEEAVGLDTFEQLTPLQRHRVVSFAWRLQHGGATPEVCFTPDAEDALNTVVNTATTQFRGSVKFNGEDVNRWSETATDGNGLDQGDPTTLTYSFVPDGISLLSGGAPGFGEPDTPNDLFATFDAAFGSTGTWHDLIADVFDTWSELTGIDYVQVSDDGAAFPTEPGVIGQRGDIRIGGHSIDGGGGVIAYNYFPNFGDMVLDTDNVSFFINSSNNFRNLRNTVSHEHGHGMGFGHVCPRSGTKVMEPTIPTGFDHSGVDDIAHGNRKYGDALEKDGGNDTVATASSLGTPPDGLTTEGAVLTAPRSIDAVDDEDFYAFTVSSGKLLTVTVRPEGGVVDQYDEQDGTACATGGPPHPVDYDGVMNLDFELIDTDGTTILATGASAPAGSNETADAILSTPGTYFVRILTNDGAAAPADDQVQMYAFDLDLATFDAGGDEDGDGLTNGEELTLGTDPNDGDSDDDGISDFDEVNGTSGFVTDPLDFDTDNDGLSDGDEVNGTFGFTSDPTLYDTDGDGVDDRREVLVGTDPNDGGDTPTFSLSTVPFFE